MIDEVLFDLNDISLFQSCSSFPADLCKNRRRKQQLREDQGEEEKAGLREEAKARMQNLREAQDEEEKAGLQGS